MPGFWIKALPVSVVGSIALLLLGRLRQERALQPLRKELQTHSGNGSFDPAMVDALPDPARRYLRHAIAPGTPLAHSVRLTMHGFFRLRPGADPIPMQAEQILAPPHGLIWNARIGSGLMQFRGFDRYGRGKGAMRWWLYGIVPLVKADGPDVSRSAAGRVASESLLMPAAMLPQRGATWEAVDEDTANVRLAVDGEPCTLSLTVDSDGRVRRASLMRWREDAGNGRPGYVRFDVDEITEERTFDGYTIPVRFRAGWNLGAPDEYPFFYATIDSASFR